MDGRQDINNLPFVRQYNVTGEQKKQTPNAITSQWLQNAADPFQFGFKPNPLAAQLYGKKADAKQKPLADSLKLDTDFQRALSDQKDNASITGPSPGIEALSSRLQFFGNSETLPSQN